MKNSIPPYLSKQFPIKVKPYLKMFLLSKYGKIFPVQKRDLFNQGVKVAKELPLPFNAQVVGNQTSSNTLTLLVNENTFLSLTARPEIVGFVTTLIEALFDAEFFGYVNAKHEAGEILTTAFLDFLDIYDIDEDFLSVSTCAKKWQKLSQTKIVQSTV